MKYEFLIESYASSELKVLSVWDGVQGRGPHRLRPNEADPRGRRVREQMVHQCVSEDLWFRNMLGIDVHAPPLPEHETRLEFMKRYAEDSSHRLARTPADGRALVGGSNDVLRGGAIQSVGDDSPVDAHSHHRGQQTAMLRMLGRDLHSTYGPTADTGGLMQNHAPTIYAYANVDALLTGEERGGAKSALPRADGKTVTERPNKS
jgi:hypothetical protein